MYQHLELVLQSWITAANAENFWWQFFILTIAAALASLVNHRLQRLLQDSVGISGISFRHLALQSLQRLLWPVSALLVVIVGRAILGWYAAPVALVDIAMPVLIALAAVRVSVYVLRKAFTDNPMVRSSESAIVLLVWGVVILHLLGWLPDVLAMLDAVAIELGTVRVSVLSALQFIMMVGVAFTLAIWLSEVINRQLQSAGLTPSMQVGISKFSRFLLITLAFLIALNAAGIDLSSLAIFGGALGVGLGFGLQRIASNFISGFILVFDRSIKPGDIITVGQNTGSVHELRARYVVVRNREGVDTLIPNENLITSEVVNWSFVDRNVRTAISVQCSYKDDPEQAMALMLESASASPRVLTDPAPVVRLIGFGENGMDLQLQVWVNDPENGFANVKSDINLAIWRAFKAAGITMPYPQRDLHITSMPGAVPGLTQEDRNG
jgi:small-conductance mechanosensitive channel